MTSKKAVTNGLISDECATGQHKAIIVVAHAWYGDMIGGSFRLATEIARHFARGGRPVIYVCCSDRVDRLTKSEEDGVTIWRYPPPQKARLRPSNLWYHATHTRQIVQELLRSSESVFLNGHSPLQYRGAFAALARTNGRVETCYSVHSPFDEELRAHDGRAGKPLKTWLAPMVARRVDRGNIRLSNLVQTDSHYTRDVLVGKYGRRFANKTVVVPGWVDVSRFVPARDRTALRGELPESWHTDEPIFLTVRRLEPRMGNAISSAHQSRWIPTAGALTAGQAARVGGMYPIPGARP